MTDPAILYRNGRLRLVAERPAERVDLLVRAGRFVHVGEPLGVVPAAVEVDLRGQFIWPGLHDAHCHFLYYGHSLGGVDLFEAPSVAEAVRRVAERARSLAPGRWIFGRGWLQDLWSPAEFPTRDDLDPVTPEHPVVLGHKSGHAVWTNSLALRLAGIDEQTADPPGGRIVRDAAGRPTGVLLENAIGLLEACRPAPSAAEHVEAVRRAQAEAHRCGLTAVQCFDGVAAFGAYQTLRRSDELRLRVTSHVARAALDGLLSAGVRSGLGDEWLRLGQLKLFADGALGSLTAWMLEPYEGQPDNYGVCTLEPEEIVALATRASLGGIPAAVHAIGDRACREVLDAFERVRAAEGEAGIPAAERRHRIEHAQVLAPEDLDRFAPLGVVASMQPLHATQDMVMVDRHWGARGQTAYAFATLRHRGARLAFGSDAPVESIDPFAGLHAAVTRRRRDGSPGADGWYPAERLTLAQALEAYTVGSAYAAGRERELGRLAPGWLADFIALETDPFALEPMALATLRPTLTVIGGQRVWAAPDDAASE